MKKFFRSSISILLAVFLIAGGGGIVLGKMICLHSGHVVYSFSEAKDCCGDDCHTPVIKNKCCALTNIVIKSGDYISQSRIDIPSPVLAISTLFDSSFSLLNFKSEFQIATNAHAPPEINCASRLSFLSIYRI